MGGLTYRVSNIGFGFNNALTVTQKSENHSNGLQQVGTAATVWLAIGYLEWDLDRRSTALLGYGHSCVA